MSAIFHPEIVQRDEAWFKIRAGVPTSSELKRIVTPTGQASSQCVAYFNRLLAEWVLNEPIMNDFESDYMVHGRENEDAAVRAFEFQTELITKKTGFVTRPDGMVGASPDRLVYREVNGLLVPVGSLEVKCPSAQVQIAYSLYGIPFANDMSTQLEDSLLAMPRLKKDRTPVQSTAKEKLKLFTLLSEGISLREEYKVQIQSQLWILEWEKGFASSYHPSLPSVIVDTERDEPFISTMSVLVNEFVDRLLERRAQWEQRHGKRENVSREEKHDGLLEEFGVSEQDIDDLVAKGILA